MVEMNASQVHLRNAKENGRSYTVDEHHDPVQVIAFRALCLDVDIEDEAAAVNMWGGALV